MYPSSGATHTNIFFRGTTLFVLMKVCMEIFFPTYLNMAKDPQWCLYKQITNKKCHPVLLVEGFSDRIYLQSLDHISMQSHDHHSAVEYEEHSNMVQSITNLVTLLIQAGPDLTKSKSYILPSPLLIQPRGLINSPWTTAETPIKSSHC